MQDILRNSYNLVKNGGAYSIKSRILLDDEIVFFKKTTNLTFNFIKLKEGSNFAIHKKCHQKASAEELFYRLLM